MSLRYQLQGVEDNLKAIERWLTTAQSLHHNGDANGRVCDQVYMNPAGFWMVAFHGKPLADEWTTREAAQDHLNTLRRTA